MLQLSKTLAQQLFTSSHNNSIFMKFIIVSSLFWFFCNLCSAAEVDIYRKDSDVVMIDISVFSNPIQFSKSSILDLNGNSEPEWLTVFLAKHRLDNSYDEWRALFSDELANVLNLSAERFEELKRQHGEEFGIDQNSVLFQAKFKRADEEFFYVVIKRGSIVSSFSKESIIKGSGYFFEKVEGKWLMTTIGVDHWLNYFAFNDLNYLEDIIEQKHIIAPKDGEYVRYFDGVTQVYDFFLE